MAETSRQLSPTEWRVLVERWRQSGLSGREFAAREGINRNTLWGWSSKFGREQGSVRRRGVAPAQAAVSMLPVQVVSSPSVSPRPVSVDGARYEIVVGAGRLVRVGADFEPGSLVRLIRTLEGAC